MGRGKPPRMRDLPHSHSVPRHAIVQANGSRGTFAPPRLESVRHRPCGFPAAPHVAGGIRAGLWLDLPASFRSSVNLAPTSSRLARRTSLSRYVLSVQALQPVLAPIDQARSRAHRVVTTGRTHTSATRSLSSKPFAWA